MEQTSTPSYNFRAPQYVDFMNLDDDDHKSDASAFFARDLESSVLHSEGSESRRSSMMSVSSEDERTLTPSAFARQAADLSVALSDTPSPVEGDHCPMNIPRSLQKFPSRTSAVFSSYRVSRSPNNSPLIKTPSNHILKPGRDPVVAINVIPPTPTPTNCGAPMETSVFKVSPAKKADIQGTARKSRRDTAHEYRRRSSSVSALEDDDILRFSLEGLKLTEKKAKPSSGANFNADSLYQKRKRSPAKKSVPDYSLQPEKFISLSESVMKIQKATPKRFRTHPRTVTSQETTKNHASTKSLKSNCQQRHSIQPSASRESSVRAGSVDGIKSMKVPRWPAPKVEPMEPRKYTPVQLPKVVFNFSSRKSGIISNSHTPFSEIKKVTKVEPFSFDKRDQELIQRKLERQNAIYENTRSSAMTRRSKSQGPEISLDRHKLVHHAKPATVLQKPPFKPVVGRHKATKPENFELETEKRARERQHFDQRLRLREEERMALVRERQEKEKQEEEMKICRLRKDLTYKAHPMPSFHKFQVRPSNAPLTEPQTPDVLRHHKHNHNMSNKSLSKPTVHD